MGLRGGEGCGEGASGTCTCGAEAGVEGARVCSCDGAVAWLSLHHTPSQSLLSHSTSFWQTLGLFPATLHIASLPRNIAELGHEQINI